jgi:hypothetical protein
MDSLKYSGMSLTKRRTIILEFQNFQSMAESSLLIFGELWMEIAYRMVGEI